MSLQSHAQNVEVCPLLDVTKRMVASIMHMKRYSTWLAEIEIKDPNTKLRYLARERKNSPVTDDF